MKKPLSVIVAGLFLSGCAQVNDNALSADGTSPQMEYGNTCYYNGVTSVQETSGGGSCPARQSELVGTHCTCFTAAGILSGQVGK